MSRVFRKDSTADGLLAWPSKKLRVIDLPVFVVGDADADFGEARFEDVLGVGAGDLAERGIEFQLRRLFFLALLIGEIEDVDLVRSCLECRGLADDRRQTPTTNRPA